MGLAADLLGMWVCENAQSHRWKYLTFRVRRCKRCKRTEQKNWRGDWVKR